MNLDLSNLPDDTSEIKDFIVAQLAVLEQEYQERGDSISRLCWRRI